MNRPTGLTARFTTWFTVVWLCLPFVATAGDNPNPEAQRPPKSQRRPQPRHRFTVATYNVENLLDVFDDPYSLDEQSPVKPRVKIEKIAQAIGQLDADIVVLQEVEHEGLLRAIVHDLLGGKGYEYMAVEPTNSYYGANLGVISRFPIVTLTSHRQLDLTLPNQKRTWRFARDLLRVVVELAPDQRLDLFVVHFKHGQDPRSRLWRRAEAKATDQIVRAVLQDDPNVWLLLAGDFNDTPESETLSTVLDHEGGSPSSLVDLHATIKPSRRVTALEKRRRNTVDYLLASPALVERLVAGSARVLGDADVLSGSDHAPVVATFEWDTTTGDER